MKLNEEILEINEKIKKDVDEKIASYKASFNYEPEKFYCEVAFCILTPQSKALSAWKIIETLDDNRLLYNGSYDEIVDYLNTIRFKNTKAKRLIMLRELMTVDGELNPKKVIMSSGKDIFEIRKWLVDNVNGMGLKEASHVLRNLGMGENIAILDRHILRVLKAVKVIDDIPNTLTYKKYLEIEEKMRDYSKKIGISMDRLDLVLWYRQVGYIFK
ncbi:N-glycosylase/DNA lyase [Oceanivirga salmonicida]|uniref:N-glycosylase/DNA lyase n=1 Tax=Oceanivirga salmonicida TaxID=1769291 RepID=UPI000830E36F|nr:N-glycosylase/DNA lyase [Oceanivirga salmonicida]